jgi:hypothetical protein
MRKLLLLISLFVGMASLSLRAEEKKYNPNPPRIKHFPVAINQVCVIPIKETEPKWIELKNVSDQEVDLSGWQLEDSEKCFYKFENEKMPPRSVLVLLFYEEKDRDIEFERKIPDAAKRIIVEKGKVFNREKIIMSPDTLKQTDEKFIEKMDCIEPGSALYMSSNANMGLLLKKAVSYLSENSLPEKYLFEVMVKIAYCCPYEDEIILLDKDSNVVSYLYWSDDRPNLKWRNYLDEQGYHFLRSPIQGCFVRDNQITTPQLIYILDSKGKLRHWRLRDTIPGSGRSFNLLEYLNE